VAVTRRFELDDLLIRPGTYFNPQTEILVVVDDSPELDREVFDTKEIEGPEWVLISDETPIDESLRDEVLERFQSTHLSGSALDADEDEEDEEEDDLEPDEEEVDLD
jgi:hypothetical protein